MTIITDRWKCCGKKIRTKFCPQCGAEQGTETPAYRARQLYQEFQDEAALHRRAADTHDAKADALAMEYDENELCDPDDFEFGERWKDVIKHKRNSAEERRKRALRIESWACVIRDLLKEVESES